MMRADLRTMRNAAHQAGHMAALIAAEQRAQRRAILAVAATLAFGIGTGWLIEQGFTALNAARLAGGW